MLSPKWSLYDLQKLIYGFCDNRDMAENGFSRFTQKRKVVLVELRVVISANINSFTAVILSQKWSLYDLQKLN